MDVVDATDPDGVVVTLGGQTPLKLARALEEAGVPIMGTSPDAIDLAEDRDRFAALLDSLDIAYPRPRPWPRGWKRPALLPARSAIPCSCAPATCSAAGAWGIVYDDAGLARYVAEATAVSPDHPVYLDKFLEGAVECDLDALCDGEDVYIGGIMEHIEMAGHPLGRLGLLPAALLAVREGAGRDGERRPQDRPGPGRARSGEHPVRREGRGRLRHRGQPAGEPHGALHLEGDGRALSEAREPHHGGGEADRAEASRAFREAGPLLREGGCHALRPLPGGRCALGAGNALHRRGHGHRGKFPGGLYEDPDGHRLRRA